MIKARMVFIHGRAQQGKSEQQIINEWVSPLKMALGDGGDVLDQVDIVAPFYGDRLDELAKQLGDAVPDDIIVRGEQEGIDDDYRRFVGEYVELIRQSQGITDEQIAAETGDMTAERGPQNWRWVLAIIRTLDKVSGLDGDMIERFLRDVWIYLERRTVRKAVDDIVTPAFATDLPIILITHSLGTVVGYHILQSMTAQRIPLFITLGSPLGLGIVKKALVPIKHPATVEKWVNARDVRDVVSLYSLDGGRFPVDPEIENHEEVWNRTPNAHGIAGYLDDAIIARHIAETIRAVG